MILRWLLYGIPSFFISWVAYILAPVNAMLVRTEPRTDRVKRMNNATLTLERDYLIKPLMWFQTHDNALDEWWYGDFNDGSWFKSVREATQEDYNNNAVLRWYCRVMWLWRNCAYGFAYHLFGRDLDLKVPDVVTETGDEKHGKWSKYTLRANSFQYEAHTPLWGTRYNSMNIGWKTHKGFSKAMRASRLIGLKRFKGNNNAG